MVTHPYEYEGRKQNQRPNHVIEKGLTAAAGREERVSPAVLDE